MLNRVVGKIKKGSMCITQYSDNKFCDVLKFNIRRQTNLFVKIKQPIIILSLLDL